MNGNRNPDVVIPAGAHYVREGGGPPVIMLHGIAASHHDWDELVPELARDGYSAYAVDLLGHGDSPKPESRAYRIEWLFEHLLSWIKSLRLTEPAVLIGHSMGGYLALEYARRVPAWTRGLVLVNPLYTARQLPPLLRRTYRRPALSSFIIKRTPRWMFRMIVDVTSMTLGRGSGGVHALPEQVRAQTAQDYTRTSPGVYNIPNTSADLTRYLHTITLPTLVVWGERDQTLSPSSFPKLIDAMPRARGISMRAGHTVHQSHPAEFNSIVKDFLRGL